MSYNPKIYHRRSIRLRGYDYTRAGAYFITIVTRAQQNLLSEIHGEIVTLTEEGRIVQACWEDLPNHYPHVELDAFVIMPNHVHGIIVLVPPDAERADLRSAPTQPGPTDTDTITTPSPVGADLRSAPARKRHGLPEIVRAFKGFSTRRINEAKQVHGVPFWQRNYYEHIIRSEASLSRIRHYVDTNPLRWAEDKLFTDESTHLM